MVLPREGNEGNAYVLGVGMAQFLKPRATRPYTELAFEAGAKAMLDAHITYDDVEAGIACYTSTGPTCTGQRVFYQFGMTNIPIYNTNNACASGSTGLHLARTFVKSGLHDCVLVVGFEQMAAGPLVSNITDRPTPYDLSVKLMSATRGWADLPKNPQLFGNAGKEYMERYGATAQDFAEIARISHEHSSRNPYAQFQTVYTVDDIQKSPMIHYPLTKLQCSPTSDGAAAGVVVSQKFLDAHPELKSHAVLIAGQSIMSDGPLLYSGSAMELVGYDMTRRATRAALAEAGVTLQDIRVCELHDCFSTNELISLDAMGFCDTGKAHYLVRSGDITYGGKGPLVNPSGGLISKGHPLAARVATNGRLVPDTKVALQHNIGLGGAVVVTVYQRADGKSNTNVASDETEAARMSGLGYNPAVEARYITRAQANAVRSTKAPSDYALDSTIDLIEARLQKL
ncbi:hypothetical protein ABOM_011457 [Aspergillus bombycis]|uniref:Nonspecific lipid-transfer protein n=1 Tax=Aspergillus bombycis TaxID=109264 RepID=A0A1F7ZJM7_9EURO|nr:hypothetical protein ABOM_011457 [Aspergillus bombycis]OGM39652.1 hypothetical protein ABOM_011457 [Aspergillus bombycis]